MNSRTERGCADHFMGQTWVHTLDPFPGLPLFLSQTPRGEQAGPLGLGKLFTNVVGGGVFSLPRHFLEEEQPLSYFK